MRYAVGQPVRVSTTVVDVTGAPVDPGTIALQLRAPDGTPTTFAAPAHDGTGLYHQDIAGLTLLGRYQYAWVTTGVAAGVAAGGFDLVDPFAPALVGLDEIKKQLNKTSTVDDDEIQGFLDAATEVIELTVGAVVPRTVTEVVNGGRSALVLTSWPVLTVTSIVGPGPVSYGPADAVVSGTAGLLTSPRDGWPWPVGQHTVVYTAGRTLVPAAIGQAAKLLVAHMWETQRGGAAPRLGPSEPGTPAPGTGYAVPNRVSELLAPFDRGPGIG